MPKELADEVARREQTVAEAMLHPENLELVVAAIPSAEYVLQVRRTSQGDAWWQTVSSRIALTVLRQLSSMSAEQLAELAEALSRSNRIAQLVNAGERDRAIELTVTVAATESRLLGESNVYQFATLTYLAQLYGQIGRSDQAESLYLRLVDDCENLWGREHPSCAMTLDNLGLVTSVLGRYERAEALFSRAAETLRITLGEEHRSYMNALLHLADAYRDHGRYLEAEPLYRRVAETWKKTQGEARYDHAKVLNGLASLYQLMGRYSDAEPLYRQVLEIVRTTLGDTDVNYAAALNNLGLLNLAMGQYERAEKLLLQAAEIVRKALGEEHPTYAEDLMNLAHVYQAAGRQEQAEVLLRQAVQIQKKVLGEGHPSYARSMNNLAKLYHEIGRDEEAEPLARLAVELFRKALGEEHPTYAMGLGNLAAVYLSMGRHEEAEPLYRQALEISRRVLGEEHPDYTRAMSGLALALQLSPPGRSEASALLLTSAELQWKHMTRNFASLTAQQKRQFLSSSRFLQSDVLEALVFRSLGPDASQGLRGALLTKQLLFEAARQESGAMVAAVSAAPPAWRALWQEREQLRREYATLALRARADEGRSSSTPRDIDRFRALTERIEQLEQDLRRGNQAYASAARLQQISVDDVTRAVRRDEVLIEYVRYEVPGVPSHYGAFVLRGMGDVVALDLGEAPAIEVAVEAFRGAVRASIDQFGSVTPSARAVRQSEETIAQTSSALRALIWDPVEKALAGARRVYVAPDGALSLIPFEALARTDASGAWKYLVEERELVYLSTGRDLARLALSARSSSTGASTAVLIGNPAFGATLSQIAVAIARPQATSTARATRATPSSTLGTVTAGAARHDVPRTWQQVPLLEQLITQARRQLTRLGWTVRTLTNTQAVEEAVLEVQAPRLLQFATHGYILDKPVTDPQNWDNPLLRSMLLLAGVNTWEREQAVYYRVNGKLVTEAQARAANLSDEQLTAARVELADGILTAYEVTGMNLQGTELVNLTACETGLGEVTPDGVVGLRQAFLLAGARALTMSMWEVPAAETTTQMGDFYERWLGGAAASRSTTRYGAFRAAQVAALARARQTYGTGHPFYWAGTVYVGDPGDLPAVTP